MDLKESVVRQFGAVAANYATSFTHAQGPDLERLVARAVELAPARVLDVACGAGHTALALAAAGLSTTAVDLTEEMLAQGRALARERGVAVVFDRGDVEALPYPDGSFDLVVSRLAAHHFPDPARAVREIARVLGPDGRFLLVDVVSFHEPTADSFLQTIELLRDPSHVRDHRVDEWQALCSAAGLASAELERWPLPQDFDAWVARMRTPEPEVAVLRRLFASAPDEACRALAVGGGPGADFSFTIALLEAWPEAA